MKTLFLKIQIELIIHAKDNRTKKVVNFLHGLLLEIINNCLFLIIKKREK
jgi:hypothetical protein